MTTHLVIPDTQAKAGVPVAHLRWIGRYILDRKPDVVVHLGDHWDMPSLSSYDKGKKSMEGRRYLADVAAGNEAFQLLNEPLNAYNATRVRFKEKQWWPDRHLLRGNHEHRIVRAVELDAQLEGVIGLHDLQSPGWQVHEFLDPVDLHGVVYAHYFANRGTGKPLGGQALTRLKQLGHTFVQGHQQVLEVATRYVLDKPQWGIVAGSCYLHHEDYLGPQGNHHWRGVIVLHQVEDGAFDPMFVSLDYLCRRYEGVPLQEFLNAHGGTHGVPAEHD